MKKKYDLCKIYRKKYFKWLRTEGKKYDHTDFIHKVIKKCQTLQNKKERS